ncbi:uncharacterized protein LOC142621806 [Castanea sativa]|uniref:uncharacterized protein LOC142621806 n=1 Tax=Castanea sativa TaxID=21020 RepID=UPI003F64C727
MASTESTNPSEPVPIQHTQSASNSNNDSAIATPSNPYFLSSSENPWSILVTQPLLGMKNYQSWSRAMILALTTKKKIGFVNGKITKLDSDSPLYEDWESSREMWIELQNLFSQGNGPKIYNLQNEISHIAQNQMSVTEYYIKFKRL